MKKDKKSFKEFYFHDDKRDIDLSNLTEVRYASIDPGKKNFSILIEMRNTSDSKSVETIFHDLRNLKKTRYGNDISLLELTDYLDSLHHHFKHCDFFIIEKQLKINRIATEIMYHIQSYLIIKYRNTVKKPSIFFVEPILKNDILKLDNSKNHIKVKTITVYKNICEHRNDIEKIKFIDSHKKKDDICDVGCQSEALCEKLGYKTILSS